MGRFLVFEGLDGAGTTTQLARLSARLEEAGCTVTATREPTDGPVGRVIRQTLRAEEGAPYPATLPWMFAADRADHLARTVEPALTRGAWVLSDRYYHSSLAYQSMTLPIDEVYALNRRFRVPDLTIFLDVSVDVAMARIEARGEAPEIFETRAHLEKVSWGYGRVFDLLRDQGEPIAVLDADSDVDAVAAAVWARVVPLLSDED